MVMFNMISEKEYNRYIYNTISELIFDCGDSYQDKFVDSRADNLPVHIREILAEISDKSRFHFYLAGIYNRVC